MDILVSLRRRKPVAVVMPSALAKEKMEAERKLGQASIPVFPTMERAATAISKISQYFRAKGT
jgi:acyl-CoA synthetase (NDP forming)